MSTEREKSQQEIQLNRQHLKEWNENLAIEVQAQINLESKHKEEYHDLYLKEVNYHERARLISQQLQEIKILSTENAKIRVAIRKRHSQETDDLNQKLS